MAVGTFGDTGNIYKWVFTPLLFFITYVSIQYIVHIF